VTRSLGGVRARGAPRAGWGCLTEAGYRCHVAAALGATGAVGIGGRRPTGSSVNPGGGWGTGAGAGGWFAGGGTPTRGGGALGLGGSNLSLARNASMQ